MASLWILTKWFIGLKPDQLRLMDNKQGSYVYVIGSPKTDSLPSSFAKIASGAKKSSKWAYNVSYHHC